jgi:predicted NBD/HSP70 family sugar kinase
MEIGRRCLKLRLRPTLGYVVGIDLGTFNLRVAITDMNGAILGSRQTRTQIDQGWEKVLENCFTTVRETLLDTGDLSPRSFRYRSCVLRSDRRW